VELSSAIRSSILHHRAKWIDGPGAGSSRPYEGHGAAWNGRCVFIGQDGGSAPIAPHSHTAIEIAIGMPSSPRVQFGRRGASQRRCHAADIATRPV